MAVVGHAHNRPSPAAQGRMNPPAQQGANDQYQPPDTSNLVEGASGILGSDPKSLDLVLLDPMRDELKGMLDMAKQAGDEDTVAALEPVQQAVDAMVQEQIRRLDLMAGDLTDDWQDAVKAKRPIEDRWIDDTRQFMGIQRVRRSKAYPGDSADGGGRVADDPMSIHATRSHTLMCWGRLSDMMLPGNDFPMRVDAPDSPDPAEYQTTLQKEIQERLDKTRQDMQQQAQDVQSQQPAQPPADPNNPQPQASAAPPAPTPPPPIDPDELIGAIASKNADQMQAEVFQMLRDGGFSSIVRKSNMDAAVIGCGLFKGPFPAIKRCRKQSQGGAFTLSETPTAGMAYVNPWFFWYDLAPSLDRSSATYEVQIISKRELAEYKRYPRTITSTIDDLLKEKCPKLDGQFRAAIKRRNSLLDLQDPIDDCYALLETHKVIDPDRLKDVLGIDWQYDELPIIHMWSINGRCIKFKLSPLERDFRLDYYNLTIMPADDTIYGYGYPYLMRASQRLLDGAVDATVANAGAAVAPMLLVAQGKVQPNREKWRARGFNVFSVENQSEPLENFFASVQVASNVEGNLKLVEFAREMMDEDSLFQQILQGQTNGEEMPASGMVMSANIASVFQKSIASYADDNAFQPFCERLIWWRQMYGDVLGKPPIEGDMVAKGIAGTQLVAKDLALQHTQAAIQASMNPLFQGFSDAYSLYEALFHNIDGLPNREKIVLDRDKALANQAAIQAAAQKGSPDVAAKLAADIEINKDKLASAERVAAMQGATQLKVAQLTYSARIAELLTQKNVDIATITAQIQKAADDRQSDQLIAMLEGQIKVGLAHAELTAKPSPFSAKD